MLLLEYHWLRLAFFLSHLTETVSFQQLASLCGCNINIVSSFGSLGHYKVVKVITYLCGCEVDWSQTICFLCISAQPLGLIGWAVVIRSGGQQQPTTDSGQISKLLTHVSHFSLYNKLGMMRLWTRQWARACGFLFSLHQSAHFAYIMY